jgi:hypothetical protein
VSCRHTSHSITDYREGALPFWQALRMRFHLAVCPGCSEFARQLDLTKAATAQVAPEAPSPGEREKLLEEFRRRKGR